MADKEAERIKFETEMLKLTATIAVLTGGGSLSLALGSPPLERAILAGIGMLVTLGLTGAVWWQRRYIRRLIERIGEHQ